MRAFVLFLVFLALLAQLFLVARHYAIENAPPSGPIAERTRTEKTGQRAAQRKEAENPVRGIEMLRGSVATQEGAPLAGVAVTIIQQDFEKFDTAHVPRRPDTWRVNTDAGGLFSVNTLAPGDYVVRAETPGGVAATTTTLEAHGSAGEVKLTPQPSRDVPGTVTDSEGKPLKGARVFVLGPAQGGAGMSPYRYFPVLTEEDGSFLMEKIPQTPAAFLAVADKFAPALIREGPAASGKPAPLRFGLGPGTRLAGYLNEAESGRQADRTGVILTEREFGIERVHSITTAAASFLFDNLRAASYEFTVEPGRYALDTRPMVIDVRDGLSNLDLRVIKAGRIKGRVVQEDGREGIPGIRVTAAGETDSREVFTNASGFYAMDGLLPGTYKIRATDPSRSLNISGEGDVTVSGGRLAEGPKFTVARGASITGRILDAAGRPTGGANLFVAFSSSQLADRGTRSGADGRFVQDGIPAGSLVRIWAEQMGKASVTLGPQPVPAEGLHDLTFTLSEVATGAISGTVVDSKGHPVPGATVQCARTGMDETTLRQSCQSDGAFRFDPLQPGNYTLVAAPSPDGLAAGKGQQTTLEPGQHVADFRLVLP